MNFEEAKNEAVEKAKSLGNEAEEHGEPAEEKEVPSDTTEADFSAAYETFKNKAEGLGKDGEKE